MKTIILDNEIGGWWGITASSLRRQLGTNKNEDITIKLNTPGGDVFEGFAIYQLLKEYDNITVEVGALVASAGTYAILSAKKVIVNKTSTLMIHKAWGFAMGNASEVANRGKLLADIDSMIAEAYALKTNGAKEDMLKAMADETWFVGGDVIKDFGLADEVIGEEEISEKDEMVAKNTIMAAIENYRNEAMQIAMGKPKPQGEGKHFNLFGSKEENLKIEQKKPDTTNQETPVQNEQDNKTAITNAVMEEKARIMSLIKVSGVTLNAELENAISESKTKEQFCVALVEGNIAIPKNNTEAIGEIAPAPAASETVPTESKTDKIKNELEEMYKVVEGSHV